MRGYQHPLIQFAQRYGVERHLEMMSNSSYACDVADEPIEGTGRGEDPGEPDCISGSRCMIYEFKPDSPTGEAAFREQESRYLRGVTDFLVKHLSNGTVPSIRGGQQLIENLKRNNCWDAGTKRLSLRIEMARYRVCEKRYECVNP